MESFLGKNINNFLKNEKLILSPHMDIQFSISLKTIILYKLEMVMKLQDLTKIKTINNFREKFRCFFKRSRRPTSSNW